MLITILDDKQPAGFAMVARQTTASRAADFRMAEFFVARGYRRRGLGRRAVRLILDRFAGSWEILEYSRNPAAVNFWRSVVAEYTRGEYRERSANGEVRPLLQFNAAAAHWLNASAQPCTLLMKSSNLPPAERGSGVALCVTRTSKG